MKTFQATQKTTLKQFTEATYPQGSFYFNALLKRGDIKVNGKRTKADCPLSVGDTVVYYTSPEEEQKPSHTVIYADERLMICDKFSGVNSEALFYELKDAAPYPVHRLDRNTAGLIVIAKTERAQQALIKAFAERSVKKVYLCLAKNAFTQSSAILSAYLQKDGSGKVKIFDAAGEGRVRIVTEYEVVKEEGDIALVRVTLHTGKTHQIRAHLAHIGCPVLGDTKYGDFALNKKYSATRQRLVAKSLTFNLSGELSYLNAQTFTGNFFPEK